MLKDWDELVERVAREIYEGNQKGIIEPEMVIKHADELMNAIVEGLGYGFDTDDAQALSTITKLQANVFHFSGAKNWNQLQEMSALLTDDTVAKTFNAFLGAVRNLDATYNATYLKAEYDHAIASSQMITKWQQIEAEKEALPFLRYVAVMDERTRDEHRRINDTVLPVNHSFWNTHYPPNDWGCRCSVQQLDEDDAAEYSQEPPSKLPKVPTLMRNNVGKTGIVFSSKHPYFETIPKKWRKQVATESDKLITKK